MLLTLSSFPTAVYSFHSLVDEQGHTQRLGQHRFITAYIAVCIKGLYTVYNGAGVRSTVTMLGLTTNQGRREPQQGIPRALASGEEQTRSEVDLHRRFPLALRVPLLWRMRRSCQPGRAKTSPQGRRKTVPRRILGCSCCNGEDTSRSENEIHLAAARPPG
jgi:hypothetical protein